MTSNKQITSTGDLFQVQFTLNDQTVTTKCLRYGASADDLEVEPNKLANLGNLKAVGIDHINVTREGVGQAAWGFGYEYLAQFQGRISGGFSSIIGDALQLEIGNVGRGACVSGAVMVAYPALSVRRGCAGFTYDIFFLNKATHAAMEYARKALNEFVRDPHEWNRYGVKVGLDGVKHSAAQILAFSTVSPQDIERIWREVGYEHADALPDEIKELMKTECLYATQLRAQRQEIRVFRDKQHVQIPDWVDYSELPMISNEEREKLQHAQPATIHAASRIAGIRSATLLLLYQYAMRQPHDGLIKKQRRRKAIAQRSEAK